MANGQIVAKIMGLVLWMTIVAMEINALMGFVGVDRGPGGFRSRTVNGLVLARIMALPYIPAYKPFRVNEMSTHYTNSLPGL